MEISPLIGPLRTAASASNLHYEQRVDLSDRLRDANLAEFFLKLIGEFIKKALNVFLVWFFDALT